MSRYAVENLFGIQGLNIAWYGVIIGIGILLGALLAARRSRHRHFDSELLADYLLAALPISILCARLYYVAFQWSYYREHLSEIWKIWEGGLAIYGGILGAVLTAILFCRRKKVPFFQFADICIPSLLLGQAIGRWGNFINQEAFGKLVTAPHLQFFPYAVYIDALGEWHQATFFYESCWNLLLLVLLLALEPRFRHHGIMLPLYLIGYGIGRFWIEGLRTDSLYFAPGIRVSQWVSAAIVIAGIFLLSRIRCSKTSKKPFDFSDH